MPRPTSSPPHIHIFFLFYIPCLVFLCSLSHVAESQIQDQEQQVLLKLRQSWQDPSSLAHWVTSNSSSHCTLPEITCQEGWITELNLVNLSINYSIPPFICDLKNLTKLDVSYNNIPGKFPTVLYNCSKLVYLDLSQNYFEGPIPNELSPNLTRIEMSNNRFSGEIPSTVSSWRNLVVFDASNNLLSGTIPTEVTELSSLTTLLLGQNELSGNLPTDIVSWKSLTTLNLHHNQFSGPIPSELGLLPVLTQLDLSENELSGSIPPEISLLQLNVLNLSSNRLSGQIPDKLENAAYEASFLNNPGLCASNSFMRHNVCNSQFWKSSKISLTNPAFIIILAIATAIFLLLAALFTIRASRKKGNPKPMLTSLEMAKLVESDILRQLVEENVIGSGGSGKVYRVKSTHSGETVAVKRISNNHNLDAKLEKQFLAEVEALENLSHENIIKLVSYISCEDSKLLVYEYMENRSLDHWLHKTKRSSHVSGVANNMILDWPKRLQIALGAAEGLSYMHNDCSRPIIHRDVKSANILLDSEFNAKIADFGLARMLIKHGEAATVTAMAGSFGYIAPEYAYTRRVDEKSDVYSYGVVLLELTTGRRANDGDEDMSLAFWATGYLKDGKPISDVIDKEINGDSYLDEISNVFKLGISCTAMLPSKRPTMKEVVQVLLKCSNPLYEVKKKYRHKFDVTLLLGNSKNEERPRSNIRVLRCNTY